MSTPSPSPSAAISLPLVLGLGVVRGEVDLLVGPLLVACVVVVDPIRLRNGLPSAPTANSCLNSRGWESAVRLLDKTVRALFAARSSTDRRSKAFEAPTPEAKLTARS